MAGNWRQQDNPFEEVEMEVNPFSHPRPTPLPPEPVTFYNDIGAPSNVHLDTQKDLKKKEKELLAKEAELNKREEEVKKREEALARAGVFIEPRNWPKFFPVIHVDITNDIPVHLQRVQYVSFATLLGKAICLLWNLVSVSALWTVMAIPRSWILALVYFLLGPLAYYSWYRPLYRAMRKESTFSYGWFFFSYSLHIVFCIYAAISPAWLFVGYSLTGLFQAINIMGTSTIVGIFYFVGFVCWVLEALLSIWVIQRVFFYFRGKGKEAAMRPDAAARRPTF